MRPREGYLLHGAQDLGDLDLLSLVLGTGVSGRPVQAIASALLERFGSALAVANAPPAALARVPGVGAARAVRLHAGLQLGLRAGRLSAGDDAPVTTPQQAAAWLIPRFRGLPAEEIHGLYLDRRSRVLAIRRLSVGTDGWAVLDAPLALRPAVQLGAPRLLLAHNHPSGDPEPSEHDVALTHTVGRAARTLGVELVDHLVVAGDRWVSIAQRYGMSA